MGKRRKSGAARASYAYRRYLSEVSYYSRRGADRGEGANEIADQLRASEPAPSYKPQAKAKPVPETG